MQFAQAIATAENQTNAIARAQILAGKAAAQSIPFFRDLGEEGLRGARITTEQAAAAERLEKQFNRLRGELDNLRIAFATSAAGPMSDWLEANREAIRIAGGLGEMLRLFVFNLEAFSAEAPVEQMNRLTEALEKFQRAGPIGRFIQSPTGAIFGGREEDLKKQIKFLRFLDRQRQRSGLVGTEFEGYDEAIERARKGIRMPRGEQTGIVSQAALDEAKKRAEALEALLEARARRAVEVEQRFAALRLKTVEGFYAQGLIAEDEYWDTRRTIAEDALGRERAAIDEEIAQIRKRNPSETGTTEQIKAQRELEDALARRNKLEQEFGAFVVENSLQAAKGAREYADAVRELDARMAELEGRSAEALAIRQEIQSRGLRSRLEANRDSAGLARLDAFERAGRAQAEMNDLRERGTQITDRLALQEERIQNSLRVGAISEIEGLRRTSEARQRSVAELGAIADALDAAAASSGNERLRIQAEQFRVEMERLAAQSDLLKDKFDSIGETALAGFFDDVITGTKSVSDAFRDMANNISREISRLAAQDIAKRLFGGLESQGFGFGSFFAKLFGGGGGGLITDAFAAGNFATGGTFRVPGSGGTDQTGVFFRATPGEQVTVAPPGQGGGMNLVVNFNSPLPQDRRSQLQVAADVGRAAARATRRNG